MKFTNRIFNRIHWYFIETTQKVDFLISKTLGYIQGVAIGKNVSFMEYRILKSVMVVVSL